MTVEEHFHELGFDCILHQQDSGTLDYFMEKDGRTVNIEIEKRASNFKQHGHNPDIVDLVVCVEKDRELSVKTFEIAEVENAIIGSGIHVDISDKPLDISDKSLSSSLSSMIFPLEIRDNLNQSQQIPYSL